MKKAYLVKMVNAYLGTESNERVFLDKYKAQDYYISLRDKVKYDELVDNSTNMFGDIARDNCCLITILKRDKEDIYRIILTGYDLVE